MPDKPTLEQIQQAQLVFWPDSKFVSIRDAFAWCDQYPEWIEADAKSFYLELLEAGYAKPEAMQIRLNKIERYRNDYRQRVLMDLACALSNAYEHNQTIQFYECGLKEDGTYKWKGCRYGLDGWEYQPGFN